MLVWEMTTGLLLQSWDAHFQVQSSERQRQRQGKDYIQAEEREEKTRKEKARGKTTKQNRTDENRRKQNRRKQSTRHDTTRQGKIR
jgi:hypothetical protein